MASLPVHHLTRLISRVYHHDTNKSKIVVGAVMVLFGSWLAHNAPAAVPVPLWDAGAWLIHAFGAAPILERVLEVLE